MTRPFAGALAVVLVLAAGAAADTPDPVKLINEKIAAGWKAADVKRPAARATDAEYLRRAFLDLVGRIPTVEECLDFEADRGTDKRARLVNRLLHGDQYTPRVQGKPAPRPNGRPGEHLTLDYTAEFADYWADLWTVWLLSRTGHPTYRKQMHDWLEREFGTNTPHDQLVVKLLTATGKTNANGAVNFIAQNLGDATPDGRRTELGPFDAVPVTSRVTRLFLGVQTQCTQCHDHPFNKEWVMTDFWGVNAFFRQVKRDGTPTRLEPNANRMGVGVEQVSLSDAASYNRTGVVFYENTRNGKMLASNPKFLKDLAQAEKDEPSTKVVPPGAGSRREALAQYVVGHDNFARAYVNRVWGHLFGRGLNKEPAVDDFGSHNEVVHPELLDGLAKAFAASGYDPKALLAWVCASDAYALSHVGQKEYADPKFDPYFARMPLKAMPPEVLFDSLQVATRNWFADDSESASDTKKARREAWLGRLVQNFGDDEGNEMTFNGTIVQALQMMNGKELNGEIGGGAGSPVAAIVKKHTRGGAVGVDAVLDELFLATLSRRATADEKSKLKKLMASGAVLPAEPVKPAGRPATRAKATKAEPARPGWVAPSAADDLGFYQDVFWALLNTNEFMLNH